MPPTITIRQSECSDIAAIKAIYQHRDNYANTLQLPYPSLDDWQQFLANKPANFTSLVAEMDGQVVAQLGIEVGTRARRKHSANIGMAVAPGHQGKGVGAALLQAAIDLCENWLAVTRIELEVYTDNSAAVQLYQKLGFVQEGRCKQYAYRDGQYVDVFLMAKLKSD